VNVAVAWLRLRARSQRNRCALSVRCNVKLWPLSPNVIFMSLPGTWQARRQQNQSTSACFRSPVEMSTPRQSSETNYNCCHQIRFSSWCARWRSQMYHFLVDTGELPPSTEHEMDTCRPEALLKTVLMESPEAKAATLAAFRTEFASLSSSSGCEIKTGGVGMRVCKRVC